MSSNTGQAAPARGLNEKTDRNPGQLVAPGVGSLFAGELARGALQLLITTLAILLWFTGSLKLAALPLIAFAWIWGMFTALDYKQKKETDENSPVAMVVKQRGQQLSMRHPERS